MRNSLIKLGDKIRQRRELLHLSQSQLSALTEVSTRTIQLVEQGKGNPSLETLLKLADPIGLTLELVLKTPSQNNNE
jgi:transcriptional regulator with XRE-family HTH domain